MTGRLDGRVAVITGTASGQGRAAALYFAGEGAIVVGCDMDAAGIDHAVLSEPEKHILAPGGAVGEIVHAATAIAPEFIVSAQQRAEIGQPAQMPLANQRGVIASGLEQRGQGGQRGIKPQCGV